LKLALGTAQFGFDYGISNTQGQVPLLEVRRILELAHQRGIDTLDTASLYGDSQAVLGEVDDLAREFRIITKTIAFDGEPVGKEDLKNLDTAFKQSLAELRRKRVDGLLVHHAADLLAKNGESVFDRLSEYKNSGRVEKIGASLYTPDEATRLLDNFDIDLVQIPMNLMDRRMLESGILDQLKKAGVEIHARSAFLQGLLLMLPESIPDSFSAARPFVERIQSRAASLGVSVAALSLAYLDSIPQIDRIVIGVNNAKQLSELLDARGARVNPSGFEGLCCSDEYVINPSKWKL
jgi:aryl-alcohol dehydrogenase-like predicted oxidoreductase